MKTWLLVVQLLMPTGEPMEIQLPVSSLAKCEELFDNFSQKLIATHHTVNGYECRPRFAQQGEPT